jgi:hypothetical protein
MIRLLICAGGALFAVSGTARAETNLVSDGQLRGFLDLRAGVADGEVSWTRNGMGKTRFSGNGGEAHAQVTIGNAALLWRPNFTWDLRGHLQLQALPGQEHGVDVVEAYLTYKPMPIGQTHLQMRAGLMYPPVSLEHDGPAWTPTNTITPSAINTWIGEEVKVVGVEASAHRQVAGQHFGATVGVFGYNDTAGTLLSYRGWALHDILITAYGDLPLPTRGAAWNAIKDEQAPDTEPVRELDGRAGYYGRLDWSPASALALNLTHYDNAGDRTSYADDQWAWETRFTNLGLVAHLSENTRLLAQAMTGQTVYGMNVAPIGYWVDMDFSSAYVLLAHDIGAQTIAGRIEMFDTDDKSFTGVDNNNEQGWALTGAYRIALAANMTLAFEGLHVESERPARTDQGLDPAQKQTTLQSALQLSF